MKWKIVSSAEVSAAKSLSPHTFLDNPCVCGHGKEQHKPVFNRARREDCTAPECFCLEFQSKAETAVPELIEIVTALRDWYKLAQTPGYVSTGPSPYALLFDDDKSLSEHIEEACVKAGV